MRPTTRQRLPASFLWKPVLALIALWLSLTVLDARIVHLAEHARSAYPSASVLGDKFPPRVHWGPAFAGVFLSSIVYLGYLATYAFRNPAWVLMGGVFAWGWAAAVGAGNLAWAVQWMLPWFVLSAAYLSTVLLRPRSLVAIGLLTAGCLALGLAARRYAFDYTRRADGAGGSAEFAAECGIWALVVCGGFALGYLALTSLHRLGFADEAHGSTRRVF